MNENQMRNLVVKQAWNFLGLPYKWGGDDPLAGFDCSGFIIELLKSVGVLPRKGDWTAHLLWDKFQPYYTGTGAIQHGDLVFWRSAGGGKIIHVELLLNSVVAIGAGGGGSATKTVGDAIKQNAYIKIRPFASREKIAGFCNPYRK